MGQLVGILVLLLVGGATLTAFAAAGVHWFDPPRRLERGMRKALGGPADIEVTSPLRNQAAAIRLETEQVATVRGPSDPGLVYALDELLGAELIFDGMVAARVMRGEIRRPLDNIDPQVMSVVLRLVFDDVRDPDFELVLWTTQDPPRSGWGGPEAVQAARRFFSRVEAIVRRS